MFSRAHLPLLTLVVAMTVALPIAPATAASTVRVNYEDLDLNTADGVSTLYKRIRRAAASYCRFTREATGTRVSPAFNICVQDAVAVTVKKIDQPNLTAFYTSQSNDSAS